MEQIINNNKIALKTGIVGLLVNMVLFLLKISFGLLSGSVALIADAFNNLSDSVSNLIALWGLNIASKPADRKHPYGHERFEAIAGFVMALLMLYLGFEVLMNSIRSGFNNHVILIGMNVFIVLIISIILKFVLIIYYKKHTVSSGSDLLYLLIVDSRNDILISISMFLGFLSQKFFSFNLDAILGVFISISIVYAAVKMIVQFVSNLAGERPSEADVLSIIEILDDSSLIFGYHDLMIHQYGKITKYAIVHIEIDKNMSLTRAHNIANDLETQVLIKTGIKLDIHLDPLDLDGIESKRIYKAVKQLIYDFDSKLKFHDLRLIDDVLSFDLVCKEDNQIDELVFKEYMKTRLSALGFDYSLKIVLDYHYLLAS